MDDDGDLRYGAVILLTMVELRSHLDLSFTVGVSVARYTFALRTSTSPYSTADLDLDDEHPRCVLDAKHGPRRCISFG